MDRLTNTRFVGFIPWVLTHETEYNPNGSVKVERDADDPGGTTKYGIDQRAHPKVNIAALTEDGAKDIYFAEWVAAPSDELPLPLGEMTFDVFVNGGPAVKWVQRAINETGSDNLLEDGHCGPKTIAAAARAGGSKERLRKIVELLCQYRQERFANLAKKRGFKKYLKGWTNRNRNLKAWALAALA